MTKMLSNRKITIKEYKQLMKSNRLNIGLDVKDEEYCYKPYRTIYNY